MDEINLKKFYPIELEKKKNEISIFWNRILKEVKDEKIFDLVERVLKNETMKVNEIAILISNVEKIETYLNNKNIELHKFINDLKFDFYEKKEKRKECIMDIYQAIISYFDKIEVEKALNIFVDRNIEIGEKEKYQENNIIKTYKDYRGSHTNYNLFLYNQIIEAIKNNTLEEKLSKFCISRERKVFLEIMNKILLDIVEVIKYDKKYIEEIISDFFDRVKDEVRIESFKRVLNYYIEEYKQTEDIGVCSRVIMEKIHKYLKDPHKDSPKWQWGEFNEEQIQMMRIWLVSADLEKYFSIEVKDKIRLKFWKRYIKYIKEVRYFERLKQAIVMVTNEHIFIEFGEKGNAAYGYQKDYIGFDEIARLSINYKLKNREKAEFFISHSGNWEIKLKSKLYELGYSVKIWR